MKRLAPWWESDFLRRPSDVERIRNAIEYHLPKGHIIQYHCFNKAEADDIRQQLTPEERERVQFSWLVFPGRGDGGAAPPATSIARDSRKPDAGATDTAETCESPR